MIQGTILSSGYLLLRLIYGKKEFEKRDNEDHGRLIGLGLFLSMFNLIWIMATFFTVLDFVKNGTLTMKPETIIGLATYIIIYPVIITIISIVIRKRERARVLLQKQHEVETINEEQVQTEQLTFFDDQTSVSPQQPEPQKKQANKYIPLFFLALGAAVAIAFAFVYQSLRWNDLLESSYHTGEETGYEVGYHIGYDEGYDTGYTRGYREGWGDRK